MINRANSSDSSSLRHRVVTVQAQPGDPNELDPRNASGRALVTTRALDAPVVRHQPRRDLARVTGEGVPHVHINLAPRSIQNVSEEPATSSCVSCCHKHREQTVSLLPTEQKKAVAETAPKKPDCCKKFWCCCCDLTKECWYDNCTAEGLERQGPCATKVAASCCCFAGADIVVGSATLCHLGQSGGTFAGMSGNAGLGGALGTLGVSLAVAGVAGCCFGACCYNCCAKAAIKVNDAEGFDEKVDMAKELLLTSLTGTGSGNKKKILTDAEKKELEERRARRQLNFKGGKNDLEGLNALVEEAEDDTTTPKHEDHRGIPKLKF